MFLEVFYLNVTANTNKQKRDLFLMVVKDADVSTYIGNATVIPSGKRWVYAIIYRIFFIIFMEKLLYPETNYASLMMILPSGVRLKTVSKRYHAGKDHFTWYVCFMLQRWFIMKKSSKASKIQRKCNTKGKSVW